MIDENKAIVTSYVSPDLDGVSSMYAYAEFLNKTSKVADYYICGIPKTEVEIVCNLFDIKIKILDRMPEGYNRIIVVDTNDINSLPTDIETKQVVEIIDHHVESNDIGEFSGAKIHIEMIGAVATLIAEKFYKENIPISRESAILLYYGIISNSINLKVDITSEKDIQMADWLKSQYKDELTQEMIKEIFTQKSDIKGSLREEMEADIKIVSDKKSITIAQLELVNIATFIYNNINQIKEILREIKEENKIDYIFLNCIDIFEGYSMLISIDEESEKLVEKILNIKCVNGIGKTDKIVMRKQIVSLAKKLI